MPIIEKFNPDEWRNLASIARHFRKKDGTLGANRTYVKSLIESGRLQLDSVIIEGQIFYHIPLEWQEKENWNLNEIYEEGKEGK